jgi:hypothetical protein
MPKTHLDFSIRLFELFFNFTSFDFVATIIIIFCVCRLLYTLTSNLLNLTILNYAKIRDLGKC